MRDIAIFETLNRYRYLRSTFLHAFAGGKSETRFKERLGDLFHQGFLGRPEQQWQFGGALHTPIAYELDRMGRRALTESGGPLERSACTFLSPTAHRQFNHSILICSSIASIELAARQRSGLRFIPWSEILARAPSEVRAAPAPFRLPLSTGSIIPDGLFGLEYAHEGTKRYRFFAVEIDRGTMPAVRSDDRQSSLLGKLHGYRQIFDRQLHKKHWGISTMLVLTLTTRAARLSTLEGALKEDDPRSMFLFKAIGVEGSLAKPMRALLDEPWERAGFPPLDIAKAI